jgi:hypothetical protein
MLNSESHPVAWALFIDELADASEHLGQLIAQMSSLGQIDEIDFAIQLGHVYAHLNRAWNGRNDPSDVDDATEQQRADLTKFPDDLEPVG